MRFGVIRFPGSLRRGRRPARLPALRRRRAALAPRPRPRGRRRRRRARRLLLRRLPARRRDRPLLAGDGGGRGVRPRGRPGARHLQRLPGPLRGRPAARRAAAEQSSCASSAARWTSRSRTPTRPSRARARAASVLSIPVKHTTGRYYAPDGRSSELEANGQVRAPLRGRAEPERLARATSPASANEAGNVMGLMPHPEHAVDPLTGSTDGGCCSPRSARARGSRGRAPREHARSAPRARPDRLRVRPDRRAARARAERRRAGDVLADVVRALRLQALEEAAARAADRGPGGGHGPGRERRRGRRGRRAGGRVQGRVAQPPERRRAVPGRRHRRRRHPARRVRDRRAADRDPRLAALRRARLRALALPARPAVAGIGHYGNSIGVADGRRRDRLRAGLRAATAS